MKVPPTETGEKFNPGICPPVSDSKHFVTKKSVNYSIRFAMWHSTWLFVTSERIQTFSAIIDRESKLAKDRGNMEVDKPEILPPEQSNACNLVLSMLNHRWPLLSIDICGLTAAEVTVVIYVFPIPLKMKLSNRISSNLRRNELRCHRGRISKCGCYQNW